MGKCKQRIYARIKTCDSSYTMSRIQAVDTVTRELEIDPNSYSARDLISLFGISEEELLENGVTYEILKTLNVLMI